MADSRRMAGALACWALAAFALACGAGPTLALSAVDTLTPKPASVIDLAAPAVNVGPGTPIVVPAGDERALDAARWLADLTNQARNLQLTVGGKTAAGKAAIVFRVTGGASDSEAYDLDIEHDKVVLTAPSETGILRGVATLWQLMTADSSQGAVRLAATHIVDQPRFAWRGLLLDSSRHMQPPAYIERLIDLMALHKLNVLQWHLTDDQAWRLPVPAYPRLSSVAAWRIPPSLGSPEIDPRTGLPKRYGGVYALVEIRAIVAHARARGVTIVPEIEMPGHALSALLAYPGLSAGPLPPTAMQSDWGLIPDAFGVDDGVFTFLNRVLGEVTTLFPSRFIAIGGDEVPLDIWKASPAVQSEMKALGVADEASLQNYFIRRVDAMLASRGRRAIGWEETLQGGPLPADAAIASWRGTASAVTAAQAGHDVVIAVAPTLYFDNRQSDRPSEPPGRGWVVSLQNVYALDPANPPLPPASPGAAPPTLTDVERGHIMGVQGNLWSEHIRTTDAMDAMAWPRAAAVAEEGWTPQARRAWPDFLARMPTEIARFRALGLTEDDAAVAPAPAPPPPGVRLSQQLQLCPGTLPLNLEGQPTTDGSRPVFLIEIMDPCWIWAAADMTGVTRVRLTIDATPNNLQLGPQAVQVVHRPSASPGGEFQVRAGDCDSGRLLATEPLPSPSPRVIRTIALPPLAGPQTLCFVHAAGARVDPIWGLEKVELLREAPRG